MLKKIVCRKKRCIVFASLLIFYNSSALASINTAANVYSAYQTGRIASHTKKIGQQMAKTNTDGTQLIIKCTVHGPSEDQARFLVRYMCDDYGNCTMLYDSITQFITPSGTTIILSYMKAAQYGVSCNHGVSCNLDKNIDTFYENRPVMRAW